jgi:hypothetical protein
MQSRRYSTRMWWSGYLTDLLLQGSQHEVKWFRTRNTHAITGTTHSIQVLVGTENSGESFSRILKLWSIDCFNNKVLPHLRSELEIQSFPNS